ncbi:hypothetical protein Bhyg_08598 [Pseudolycoriella hygida]|uniref:Uncharacterized protein n=1 Tax=Pseudolycoriella hygida TaxID=35572 RepID=A0A9Q0S542_9DIPT|nr:hypothetical protein Bhyg_08598 [Pseudolycoriella hygida]
MGNFSVSMNEFAYNCVNDTIPMPTASVAGSAFFSVDKGDIVTNQNFWDMRYVLLLMNTQVSEQR